ncbi:MAG: hypothetical protein KDK40_03725, partial [Chlamydiia bacterium]|nr:hypothetical protein [Chlamydiia bacterium]
IFHSSLDPDRLCNDREYVKLLASLFVENGALIPELKRHLSSNVLSSDRETFINALLKLMPLAISGEICDPKEICWFCDQVFELLQPSSCPNKAIAENPIPMEEQIDLLQILIVSIQNNTSSPASPFDYREQILTVLNFTLERLAAMTDVRDPLVSRLYEILMTCLTSGKEDRDLIERAAVNLTAVINDSPDFFLVTRTLQLFGKLSVANAELRKALSNRLITTIGEVSSVNTLYSLLRTICDQNTLIFSMGKEMTLQLIHLIYKHWEEIISQPQGLRVCTDLLKMRNGNPTLLEMNPDNWIRFGTDLGRNILRNRANRSLFEDCYTALEKLYLDHSEAIDSTWEGLIDLLFDLHLQISKKDLQRMKTLSDLLKRKDLSSAFSNERSRLLRCATFVISSQRYSGEDVIDMVAFPLQILKQASSSKRVTEADKHIFSLFFTCLSHTGAPSIALIDGVRSKLNACGRFLAQTDPSLMISLQVLLRDFMEILIFKREKNNDTAIYNLWVQIIKSFPQNSQVFIRQAENVLLDLANQMQAKTFCSEAKRTFASSLIQNPEIASKCIHKIVLFWNVLLDEKTRNRLIDEISTAQPSLAHYFKVALESTVCEI